MQKQNNFTDSLLNIHICFCLSNTDEIASPLTSTTQPQILPKANIKKKTKDQKVKQVKAPAPPPRHDINCSTGMAHNRPDYTHAELNS